MRKVFLIFIFVFCCVTPVALAGDSASLPVSCTIPAIPGVNVPLLEKEQIQVVPESEELIQQQTEENTSVTSEQLLVKTYYAR